MRLAQCHLLTCRSLEWHRGAARTPLVGSPHRDSNSSHPLKTLWVFFFCVSSTTNTPHHRWCFPIKKPAAGAGRVMGSPKLDRYDARCRVLPPSVSRLLIVHPKLKRSFNNSRCDVQALPFSASTTRCGANGRVMGIAWLEGRTAPSGAVLLFAPGVLYQARFPEQWSTPSNQPDFHVPLWKGAGIMQRACRP